MVGTLAGIIIVPALGLIFWAFPPSVQSPGHFPPPAHVPQSASLGVIQYYRQSWISGSLASLQPDLFWAVYWAAD